MAAAAGVSKPLVYAYFDSEDGPYVFIRRAADVLVDAIAEAIDGPAPGIPERTLAAIFAVLEGRPQDWAVVFDRSHPADGPAARAPRRATHITDQAARGVEAVSVCLDLSDPDDPSALTTMRMGTVTALIE